MSSIKQVLKQIEQLGKKDVTLIDQLKTSHNGKPKDSHGKNIKI